MYVVPMTLLLLSSSTTAPLRRPGAAGVNVTLTVQVWFCRRLAPLHVPPPALAKSSPEIPRVSTSTVDTDSLPESVSITITDCALVAWPMGCGEDAGAKSTANCARPHKLQKQNRHATSSQRKDGRRCDTPLPGFDIQGEGLYTQFIVTISANGLLQRIS